MLFIVDVEGAARAGVEGLRTHLPRTYRPLIGLRTLLTTSLLPKMCVIFPDLGPLLSPGHQKIGKTAGDSPIKVDTLGVRLASLGPVLPHGDLS